jgi:hypothetical protein
MNNMPEQIWATPYDADMDGGTYCDAKERRFAPNHDAWCYIRGDIVLPQIQALSVENAQLRMQHAAILSYLAGEPSNPPVTGVAKIDLTDISETGKQK